LKSPDYSNYTLSELYDAVQNINKETYPDRYKLLISEIQNRENIHNSFPDLGDAKQSQSTDWVKNVSIISIIFGGLCILTNITAFFTADLMDMSKQMLENASKNNEAFSEFSNIFQIPIWYKTWLKAKAVISIIIAASIIYSAINFMKRKTNFHKFLILSLIFNIVIYVVNLFLTPVFTEGFIFAITFSAIWSNIVELGLLGYLMTQDLSKFREVT
jgi:hypothetical protein